MGRKTEKCPDCGKRHFVIYREGRILEMRCVECDRIIYKALALD